MFRLVGAGSGAGPTSLRAWNDLVGSLFPGMVVDGPAELEARWRSCKLGTVELGVVSSTRSIVRRWFDRSPADDGRGMVHLQKHGTSLTSQKNGQALLSAGDLTYCAPNRPYDIHISERNLMYVIQFPRSAVGEDAFAPGRVLPRATPAAGVLTDFIDSLLRQRWPETIDIDEQEALGDIVLALLRRGARELPVEAPQHSLTGQILAFVDANLADSSLRTGAIAEAFSISPRIVLSLFAEMATTPTTYIVSRRLTRARERLKVDPSPASLSDIAYEFGFSDASHFCRHFKRHFNMTPGAYARMIRDA